MLPYSFLPQQRAGYKKDQCIPLSVSLHLISSDSITLAKINFLLSSSPVGAMSVYNCCTAIRFALHSTIFFGLNWTRVSPSLQYSNQNGNRVRIVRSVHLQIFDAPNKIRTRKLRNRRSTSSNGCMLTGICGKGMY